LRLRKCKSAKVAAVVLAAMLVLVAACAVYLGDYYRADPDAVAAFTAEGAVEMETAQNGNLVWAPEQARCGLIFYPGGKVEHTAYIPLMEALSARGVLCVLVKMPFRLAVLDIDAADGIQEDFPQIESWYIGGHSLGGSMAASYLSGREDSFAGLILLGAYSTADLSQTELSVLSIFGSEDGVMNRKKYESNRVNLPADFREIIIEGGCHAYFGMYGTQAGDGTPSVSPEAQIIHTADAIWHMMEADLP